MGSLMDLTASGSAPSEPPKSSSAARSHRWRNFTSENGGGRAVKHRSSHACQSCRLRKVRCDVLAANGGPCTNCRLDRTECVVLASRRGKNNHAKRGSIVSDAAETLGAPSGMDVDAPTIGEKQNHSEDGRRGMPTPMVEGSGQVPVCVTFDEDSDSVDHDHSPATADRSDDNHATSQPYDGLLTPETATTSTLKQLQIPNTKAALPPFIAPLSSRVSSEDLDYLALKGALTVPELDRCVEILRGYMFSVHPFMPLLDFRSFFDAVMHNREDARVSLLLFQAVMFAGLHSLELPVIRRLGFESTKAAREVFFHRARLLHDFDVESDSAAVLQSQLLMSTWYGRWDDRKHTWGWTGLAYDLARSMGLHREPAPKYSSKVCHLRRRLWWSLYIRDRMITLGTRRPMRVQDEEFDVALLTLEDFDLEPFEDSHQGQPLMPNTQELTSTALMCIQLAKLCICIGHIASSHYTVLTLQPDIPHTMMVVSRWDGGRTQRLERCDTELNEWFQELDLISRKEGSLNISEDPRTCSQVQWAMLQMAYLTTVNVLHRAQALQPLPSASEDQLVHKSSRAKVKDAARSITRLSQTMLRHDQVRFFGPLGVTAFVAASLSHMLDISSTDEDVRDASTFRLYQTLQGLQSLQSVYAAADAAVSFLASVTQKAGISVPGQVGPPATDSASSPGQSSLVPLQSADSRALPNPSGRAFAVKGMLSGDRFDRPNIDSHASPLQVLSQAASYSAQAQTSEAPNPFTFTNNSANPVSMLLPPTATEPPITGNSMPQPADTTFGSLLNSTADGNIFDWNNGIDTGLDLDAMAFNYDFYSDAFSFGFLDGS